MGEPATKSDLLYHYTDASAVINILRSKTLWASNARFLNDSQEMLSGQAGLRQALVDHIDHLRASLAENEWLNDFQISLTSNLLGSMNSLGDEQQEQAYVASFCEDGDLLSQWQMYGRGGFAVGFSKSASFWPENFKFDHHGDTYAVMQPIAVDLAPVRYVDKDDLVDFLAETVPKLVPAEANFGQRGRPSLDGKVELLRALVRVKHGGFSQEHEWRLSYIRRDMRMDPFPATDLRPALQFRSGPTGIIPYIPFSFDPLSVRRIYVGPGGDQELRLSGIRSLLHEMDYGHVVTESSRVPYRAQSI